MKHLIPLIAFALSLPLSGHAAELKTYPDLDRAKVVANTEDKLVFLEFMSSTCPHCQAFEKTVLGDEAFIAFANDRLVALIYDYQEMSDLPEAERERREKLMEQLKVTGFPTIFLIAPDGSILHRSSGYDGSSAETIIATYRSAIAGKKSDVP